MKKEKNWLSNLSYRYRGLPDVPIHHLHRIAANKFSNRIEEMKKKHWSNWLKEATSSDVYLANKYITNPLTDYASTRIPSFVTTSDNGTKSTTHGNKEKAEALSKTFFPLLPDIPVIPPTAYPAPSQTNGFFTCQTIHLAILTLKPFKVSGIDGIQNIVLQKCTDNIVNYIYFIFSAILEFEEYPSQWLNILTIVLHKPNKAAYDVAKTYWPIGLLETLGKLFSTLVANNLSYIAEKYKLLPPAQFGG